MALNDAFRAAKKSYDEYEAKRQERLRKERAARAEADRIRSIRTAEAVKARAVVLDQIKAHNAAHGLYAKIVLAEDLPPAPKAPEAKQCGPWTLIQDCEDTDCFRHYAEKKELAKQGKYPFKAENLTDVFDSLFKS